MVCDKSQVRRTDAAVKTAAPGPDVSAPAGQVLRERAFGLTLVRMRIPGPFFTLPNLLSISRVLALPVFLWSLSTPGYTGLAVGLLLYAISSDLADGYLARRFNAQSEWGRILDPLADKLTSGAALVFCYFERGLPAWILLLVVGRDLAILALAPWWAARHGRVPESLWWGRLAALSVGVLLLAYLFEIRWAQGVLLAAVTTLVLISSVQYALRLRSHAH